MEHCRKCKYFRYRRNWHYPDSEWRASCTYYENDSDSGEVMEIWNRNGIPEFCPLEVKHEN